ncbi:MAG: DHH family phosphoesterase [Candidatus Gracilibacteria bacterium]|jgi:phosphoesterase RecJ-like protein|nr:DHH family phosphoesterase [Candidatus Gracilibacteria bacterium]
MSNSVEKNIVELIKKSEKILILPSSPLDGDSLGSSLSLYLVLKKLKKQVLVATKENIPKLLEFLPNMEVIKSDLDLSKDLVIFLDLKNAKVDKIKRDDLDGRLKLTITPSEGLFSPEDVTVEKKKADFDLIITVDTAELTQLKAVYDENTEIFQELPIINIDHHISNNYFGKLNLVDIMASSTTELILPLIELLETEMGKPLMDEDIATLLLAGIITDTGSFQNSNTTPKSFKMASRLVNLGARQQEIIQHVYKTKKLTQLKLWGRVLSKIQTDDEQKLVWSVVTEQDLKDTESDLEETGDIIDELLSNAPDARIVFLIKEKSKDEIAVSIRTLTPAFDASKIAEHFGGGGHSKAAGFEVKGKALIEVEYEMLHYLRKLCVA